ncbi:uncharacterized protein MELLADRAFT_112401 [Melampsora larici-populina 98AG31]|uniref:Uncharacterized protein n=1 Tax=Melampsora larici-populina (strain 98AG31 / pathotype 3-4-7) TaxID=747676 RepID=F4S6D0_MELLP|nr:uncharacterized protein MELLADRAFT_112401 [Melampsora larici-populina 98AG31]EGF99818.1 hypothetical protein MELLADRAFT_112401 [Melampsora larici-populina 98AG31]
MNPESNLSIPTSEIDDGSPTNANPKSAAVMVDSYVNRDHVDNSELLASTEQNQEDAGFISEKLSLEISKAQESLSFMTSYHSTSEDEHECEDRPSSLKQTATKTNADLDKINMTQIDVDAANKINANKLEISSTGSFEQSFPASINQSTGSTTSATTDVSNPIDLTPISKACEFHECNMASAPIESPVSLLPSKRSLSPTISKESRNLRSKLETSRTPLDTNQETGASSNKAESMNSASSMDHLSNLRPERSQDTILDDSNLPNIPTSDINLSFDWNNAQGLDVAPKSQSNHKQHLSPANSNQTSHPEMCNEELDTLIQMYDLEPENKPLFASSALPVYSKLIAALEEARLSDCLTDPMAKELLNLTLRCKRTGNAIIQRKPLPPEDKVIVLLDDETEDLATKYGFPSEIFNYQDPDQEEPLKLAVTAGDIPPPDQTVSPGLTNSVDGVKSATNPPSQLPNLGDKGDGTESISIATQFQTKDLTATAPISTKSQPAMDTNLLSGQSDRAQESNKNSTEPLQLEVDSHQTQSTNLEQQVESLTAIPLLSIESRPSTEESKSPPQSGQTQQSNNNSNAIHSQPSEAQEPMDKPTTIHSRSSSSETQLELTSILSSPAPSPQRSIVPSETGNPTKTSQEPVNPVESEGKGKSSRDLRPRRKTFQAVVIPRCQETTKRRTPPPITYQRNEKKTKGKDVEPTSNHNIATKGRNEATDDGLLGHVKFFLGPSLMEKELTKLLAPYNGNQTSKAAKLAAWNALTNLLKLRREGEPLNQVFLDSIEGGINNVMVKTKYNGQTWYNAIEETMPDLFNCHKGEPAYAADLFNTLALKNQNVSDKIPPGVPAVWNHTWRTMRMCIRPSPSRVSSFLKVLLDSVLLTGKTFLKEPPVSESEKAKTGIEAVCQAIKWLNSQRNSKPENSRTIRLLDSTKLNSVIDIGLIQQWEDIFIKVLDSYVVQYFEAKYILNEEASAEDKALAIRFKKEWKGESIKSPTLNHLTMFACCGIRGLICCSNDVNSNPAAQMLGFTILSDWLVKQRPDFQVKEPIFKRSNQMLMKLIDGLFDQQGRFVKPEITWYDVAKNLCFDYLSHWFTEAGELAEGGSLVFPKSSAFVGKDQVVRFSESF